MGRGKGRHPFPPQNTARLSSLAAFFSPFPLLPSLVPGETEQERPIVRIYLSFQLEVCVTSPPFIARSDYHLTNGRYSENFSNPF